MNPGLPNSLLKSWVLSWLLWVRKETYKQLHGNVRSIYQQYSEKQIKYWVLPRSNQRSPWAENVYRMKRALGENKIHACFFIVISIYSGDKILISTDLWSYPSGNYDLFQFLKSLRCDSVSSLEGWFLLHFLGNNLTWLWSLWV